MKRLACFALVLFLICCKDENPEQPPTPSSPSYKIKFTSSSSQLYWIVISDVSGNVLKWASLGKGETFTYSYEAEGDLHNVTLISKYKLADLNPFIYTFSEIPPNNYLISDRTFTSHSIKGTYTLFFDPTLFSRYATQTDNPCEGAYAVSRVDFNLCGDMNHLYVGIPSLNGAPKYFFTDMIVGGSVKIDKSFLTQLPEMKSKSIPLSQTASGDFALFGNIYKGGKLEVYRYTFLMGSDKIPLYYPILSELSSFDYTLSYKRDTDVSFGFVGGGLSEPEDKLSELLVDLNKATLVNSTSKLHFETTGSAKYIRAVLFKYDGINPGIFWTVLHPFKNTVDINLPQFPDDLLKEVNLNLLIFSHFTEISFEDDYELSEYNSIYKDNMEFKLDEGGPKKKNGRNKTYLFPN